MSIAVARSTAAAATSEPAVIDATTAATNDGDVWSDEDDEEDDGAPPPVARSDDDKKSFRKYVMFPTQDTGAFQLYKKQLDAFWRVEEFSGFMDTDVSHWESRLSAADKRLVSRVIGFFAASDGIVSENLVARFCLESDLAEVRAFYITQAFFEQIHSEAYSLIIDRLIADPREKCELFRAVEHHPCVRRKAEWGHRWIGSVDNRADGPACRLIAFACVEGIFFSSSFATIYWFKSRNLLPGTTLSNEWISRDEGLHTDFAVYRYRQMPAAQQMPVAELYALVDEAVEIELAFVRDSLPEALPGMNAELMSEHVRFVANRLLAQLGLAGAYPDCTECPFPYMLKQAGQTKTNFFEAQVSNYSAADLAGCGDESIYHTGAIEDGDF
jgi:ribonucleotide reductase beta subunit family protein with ferritin-like domain